MLCIQIELTLIDCMARYKNYKEKIGPAKCTPVIRGAKINEDIWGHSYCQWPREKWHAYPLCHRNDFLVDKAAGRRSIPMVTCVHRICIVP